MKKLISFILLAICVLGSSQEVTLEEIWGGKFMPNQIYGINSMADGEHYSSLSSNGIEKFSYKTFDSQGFIKEGSYSNYSFNEDESWLILETNRESIFRHSSRAVYTLYNMETGKEVAVYNNKQIQEPTLSPDGKKVAFVYENNIYIQQLDNSAIDQVTFDGKPNEVLNGINDWVYEEEFGFVRNFHWSPNSAYISYVRLDESNVKQMDIDIYGKGDYPSNLTFKYPKAGEENSKVSVHIYSLKSKNSTEVELSEYTDFYVPKLAYGKDDQDLYVFVSNRHQNKLDVYTVSPKSNQKKLLFTEQDNAWIDTDKITIDFLEDGSFIWASERDGYRHLYHYGKNAKVRKQITKGDWEVTSYYGYDKQSKNVFYQSTEVGSTNRGVYKIGLNGKNKKALAIKDGTNDAQFSKNYNYFILIHSTANQPFVYTLNNGTNGKELKVLEGNERLKDLVQSEGLTPKEFKTIKVEGVELNTWMIKPKDFDPNKEYPLLMYVYGGPGSQQVLNKWDTFNLWWFEHLAQQGIIVACVDNRGTGGKGAAFKKATYKDLGNLEIKDQIAAAKHFGNLDYINKEEIGMFGWSFGGYLTSLAMTKGAGVFSTGIAVAPVTNWRFYDTIYTERYLQTPQENAAGYDSNSPINFANQLKGDYLLVHGSADDNVHVQNSMRMAEALIQADKDFDYMVYPDRNHGIYGGNTRLHLYKKMTNFLIDNFSKK